MRLPRILFPRIAPMNRGGDEPSPPRFRGRIAGAEAPKWKLLAASAPPPAAAERLFFSEDGQAIPALGEPEPLFARYGWQRGPLRLRGYSQGFRPAEAATLALQLRALLGINVRCEIVMYGQDRGMDDTEEPLSPALSPSEGAREKLPQLWV